MKTFTHHNEPYGTVIFTIERTEPCVADEDSDDYIKYRADNGYMMLFGTVTKGSETSRLFQFTSTTDLKGQKYDLLVSPRDLEAGYRRTIAM